MIASAAPTSVAARSVSPRSVAIEASPLKANGMVNRSPVRCSISSVSRASASALVRFPSWRSTMLRLHGLGGDQELVARGPNERQSLGHPVAGLDEVARDLCTHAEEMERVRAARLVARRIAHGEGLAGEPSSFGHVRA